MRPPYDDDYRDAAEAIARAKNCEATVTRTSVALDELRPGDVVVGMHRERGATTGYRIIRSGPENAR